MSSAHHCSGMQQRVMGLWAGAGVRGEGAGLGREDLLHKVTWTGLWGVCGARRSVGAGRQAFQKPEARAGGRPDPPLWPLSVSLSQGQPCIKDAFAIIIFFLQFDRHTSCIR